MGFDLVSIYVSILLSSFWLSMCVLCGFYLGSIWALFGLYSGFIQVLFGFDVSFVWLLFVVPLGSYLSFLGVLFGFMRVLCVFYLVPIGGLLGFFVGPLLLLFEFYDRFDLGSMFGSTWVLFWSYVWFRFGVL